MKKTSAFVLVGLLFFGGSAFAGYQCETPSCVTCPAIVDTDTNTQRQPWGAGVGLDIVLLKGHDFLSEVSFENRYDVKNREYRGFVVGEIDTTKLWA